ncbi:MAG: cytochrome c family protein [Acidobacteriia bacterium]|nr:cytochrome c family protein [Terriglobia bacterium]
MPQFFPRTSTTIARLTLLGGALALAAVACAGYLIVESPYETRQDVPREQPVPFSHEHHAGGLGIDCRYCHTTVETSSFANIPATKVCMNCHQQMWAVAPDIEPIRESYRNGRSVLWTRVHDLPDFVYFDHSVHIHKGVGCSTCHGRVDRMPLTWQAESLRMKWCLDCHRDPAKYVRPRDQVFNMAYTPPRNQEEVGQRLMSEYHIVRRTSCSTCHR